MNRAKILLVALLLIASIAFLARPAAAQIYPTCPPGYFFAPAYGLCFPAGYFDNPGYLEGQGYLPYAPGFGFAPFEVFDNRFAGFHRHFAHRFGFHQGFGGRGGFIGHGAR